MRLATLDVGTNTVLMLVAERDPAGAVHAIADFARITRLGRKVATEESGRLAALLRHARALGLAPKTT